MNNEKQWYEVGAYRMDRKRFEAWLATFGANNFIGLSGSGCACPLARFLEEQGLSGVRVGYTTYSAQGMTAGLPNWALRFVAHVDARKAQYITAEMARDIMTRIDPAF